MALGWALHKMFKFPAWTIPAICFNNTTALPLLLIQSLETAGVLSDLTMSSDDSTSDALKRAKSYFLVSAMVGNSLTFAVGPKLLDDEEVSDSYYDTRQKNDPSSDRDHQRTEGAESDSEHENPTNSAGRTAEEQEEHQTEQTTLLPRHVARHTDDAQTYMSSRWQKMTSKLPQSVLKTSAFLASFLNAPLIGALIGCFVGLIPALHRVFFAEPEDGGYFKAWLTQSIKNIGELFATLQLVVVGAKLSTSLMKMKEGKESGPVPLIPMFSIFFIRFAMWPL